MPVRKEFAGDKMSPGYIVYTLNLVLKQIDDSQIAPNVNETLFLLNLFT
ncbi:hypothetical protein BAOM_2694 [Peribacillus asahii]|uniref:Uncharacterized protein n=1 Tax=Peribacillus asahii TaxID=228899 RepID=A0A3T0KSP8_9BACI|nr:hypothetical protein BAOM_2694 [Peribacillus asahii]